MPGAGFARAAPPAASAGGSWPCEAEPEAALPLSRYWPDRAGIASLSNWRSDRATTALLAEIAPRSMAEEEGIARITNFAARAPERRQAMALLVAGLVETIDAERRSIITGIRRFNDRQGQLARRIEEGYQTLDLAPPAADSPAAEQRAAVQERVDWETRVFEDRQRMLPIICRQPGILEARLKKFADVAREEADISSPQPR